jgi:glycosyltransferase involved in cell wall biosynthesis
MARVSIIVPSYNHSRFLEQRLASIVHQTYKEYEVILLDDASLDSSAEICEQFAREHPCRFVRNDIPSQSAFKQWNKGVRLATGEYVWIAESDDFADEQFLEVLVDILDHNPRCGIAYCQSLGVNDTNSILGPVLPTLWDAPPGRWQKDFINDGREECVRYLIRENTIPNASAVLFRRELYDMVGGADEMLILSSDWKFWASLLQLSDIAYVSRPLNYFRTHATSVRSTSGMWLQLTERFQVMAYILNLMEPPKDSLRDLHIRMVMLLLEAIGSERPTICDIRRTLKSISDLRFRLGLRTSAGIIKQAVHAIGRRIQNFAKMKKAFESENASFPERP